MTKITAKSPQSTIDDYQETVKTIEASIETFLQKETHVPEPLQASILYSMRAGGKRLRPAMVVMACQACGGQMHNALAAAASVEMIHTYSLIHDDLPAMDDDDLRRGKPTNHKVFGEGMAILAGDALLTYAFETLACHIEQASLVQALVRELAHGAGASGMIGGQAMDIAHQNEVGDLEIVDYIHLHKTAMMFRASMRMGALCGDADVEQVNALGEFGLKIGLAFQIVDDLLDITSSAEAMGKNTQKDEDAGKVTYPAIVGVEQSRQKVDQLIADSIEIIEAFGPQGQVLKKLALQLADRKY